MLAALRSIANPTEAKIRAATDNSPLGPYNHELTELSALTYTPKALPTITTVIAKRLETPASAGSAGLKRSHSTPSSLASRTAVRRANTVPSAPAGRAITEETSLILLKTVTVVLYLLQNGSDEFVRWVRGVCRSLVEPILGFHVPLKYQEALRFKTHKTVGLCHHDDQLREYRVSIHRMRSEMASPGVKRRSSVGPEVETEVLELSSPNYRYERHERTAESRVRFKTPRSLDDAGNSTVFRRASTGGYRLTNPTK